MKINCCQPIAQWLSEDNGEGPCRPCSLGVLKTYYQDILERNGQADLAKGLELLDDASPENLGKAFDDIKAKVDSTTAQDLTEVDCLIQATVEES